MQITKEFETVVTIATNSLDSKKCALNCKCQNEEHDCKRYGMIDKDFDRHPQCLAEFGEGRVKE